MNDDSDLLVLVKKLRKAPPDKRIALRNEILEKMNPNLRNWLGQAEERITRRVKDNLIFYWELGRDASEVHNNEKKFGANSITICVGVFQEDPSVLHKAMAFYRAFDAEELESLLAQRMKDTGRPVLWSHIVILVSVTSRSKRNQYLARLIKNNWTDEELKRHITQDMGPNPLARPGAGRKVAIPATVDKMLHHMDMNLAPIERKFKEVWNHDAHGLVRLVQNTDPAEYTPAMLQEVDKTILTVEAINEGSKVQLRQLHQVRKRLVSSLQHQSQIDGTHAADGLAGNGKVVKNKKAERAEEELVPAAVE